MLTDVYHCNNLIWVCNCQDPDWYPGDDYVDIVGVDVYTLPRQYGPLTDQFTELLTDKGERVRSKSEMIIANMLAKENIP